MSKKPEHSKIGASSYYRWKACPGSVVLSQGVESPESPYAREGTQAHDVAAGVLEHMFFQNGKPIVPLGFPPEGMDAVRTYTDFIKREANLLGCEVGEDHILIEHKFDLSAVHPDLYGTADCVLYSKKEKKLMVIDYKHGAGIPVEVEDNVQLQYYGLGALLSTNYPCRTVELVIVQPRCEHSDGPIRRWDISAIDLLNFSADLARDARLTEFPDAAVNAGDHCRFCPAAPVKCPVLHKKAQAMAKIEFKSIDTYDPKKLSRALDSISLMKVWIKTVEEFAFNRALAGQAPPNYKLVQKRAVRAWKRSEEQIKRALVDLVDEDEMYNKKILSPAQMEKVLPKEKKKIIETLVSKESSGYKLVHNSVKGVAAAINPKDDFKKIKTNNR